MGNPDEMTKTYLQAPDGGWGWLVVLGSVVMQVLLVLKKRSIVGSIAIFTTYLYLSREAQR